MDTPQLAYTWTAPSDAGRSAAGAVLRWALRRSAVWSITAVLWLMFTALLAVTDDDDASLVGRLVGASPLGLVFAVAVMTGVLFMGYRANARTYGRVYPSGAVVESGFAPDALRVRSIDADTVVRREAIRSAHVVGDWLVMVEGETRALRVLPRDLVPADELPRLGRAGQAP